MKISGYHIGFVGFGHMAQILYQSIDRSQFIPRSQMLFIRRDLSETKKNEREFGISSSSLKNLVEKSQVIVLAVRPDQVEGVLKELRNCDLTHKQVISVVAGVKLKVYQTYLHVEGKAPVEILRVMPNVASSVGEGMSVFAFQRGASREFRSFSHLLFSCMGEVIEVNEEQMDISCGIAGSGPGFVFRLIQAMARVGEKEGLPRPQALKMAAQTFAGAARLILKGTDPEILINQITTPNGTTAAGFQAMTERHLESQFEDVVLASAKRSKELSDQYS